MQRYADSVAHMQRVVEELLEHTRGISASALARRAGVNRSTLHRIETGKVEPTVATLRELAIACGLDLTMSLVPLSDPDAAAAARQLLDVASSDLQPTDGVREWIARLERTSDDGDPVSIVVEAGHASTLLAREGTALFRGDSSALRLASAGDATGGRWAVSGAAAMALTHDVRGPSILWTDDVGRAGGILQSTHDRVTAAPNAQVIVAPLTDAVYVDAFTVGAVRYVAPVQMILDCFGLGGAVADAALDIAKEWSR